MIELLIRMLPAAHYGEKTRPGRCSEPELIAQRPLMINQAREVFCQGRLPASLIYVLVVSPWPAVPSTFMPLPFRNTSAGPPVVLDTALLPCSFLPPAVKETRSDCLCPDGCALRGNVRYIAATLAAATILQTGSASTDILLSPTSPSVLRTSWHKCSTAPHGDVEIRRFRVTHPYHPDRKSTRLNSSHT